MNGKYRHELQIAPKLDKRPKIIVPGTTSRDDAIVVVFNEAEAAGRGICIDAKEVNDDCDETHKSANSDDGSLEGSTIYRRRLVINGYAW